MSFLFSVNNFHEALEAWQEIGSTGRRPYPLGGGSGSPDPHPEPAITLGGELARIRQINTVDRQVTAGCGMTIAELDAELSAAGLALTSRVFDPTKVTLGGWLGSGMPGVGGRMPPARRLLGATLLTPNGRLIHSGAATPKDVAGYDFHRPLVGAFGRLGMLLEVTLALQPKPEHLQITKMIPKHLSTFFAQLNKCRSVERLWISDQFNHGLEIMLEQRGSASLISEDAKLLQTEAEECELLPGNPRDLWGRILGEAFSRDGYYLRWALPAAQACTELAHGGWWGDPCECRLWRYLGTEEPTFELPATQVLFKRQDERLYPCIGSIPSHAANYTSSI